MAFDYRALKRKVTPIIARFGYPVAVTRPGGVDRSTGSQVIRPDTTFNIVGLKVDYDPKEIDGSRVQAGDIKFLCQAENEMKIGDLVMVDGAQWRVENPNPLAPAATTLLYQLQLRG